MRGPLQSLQDGQLLPILPDYPLKYDQTAYYHVPNVQEHVSHINSASQNDASFEIDGPVGFEKGLLVQGDQCFILEDFHKPFDSCIRESIECSNGFSFSFWLKIDLTPDSEYIPSSPPRKRYILSTGGDFDTKVKRLRQGISLYFAQDTMFIVLAMNGYVWEAKAIGHVVSNKWTNIGVTMEYFEGNWTYNSGLEVFVNEERVAQSIYPLNSKPWSSNQGNDSLLRFGCHQNDRERRGSNDSLPRDFQLDEIAFWNKRLTVSRQQNEIRYFLGGYDPGVEKYKNLDELKDDIQNFHFQDPQQFRSAFELTQRVLENIEFKCLNSSLDCSVQRAEHKIKILKTLESVLPYKRIHRLHPVDLTHRFMSIKSTLNMFSCDEKNVEDWSLINIDHQEKYPGGSISFLKYIQKYFLYFLTRANISDYDPTPFFNPKNHRLNLTISTPDAAIMALKFPTYQIEPGTKDISLNIYDEFDSDWRVPLRTWKQPYETISIPWDESFRNGKESCEYEPINILVGIYPCFGYIAPKRRNSVTIQVNNFTINSKVISLSMLRGSSGSGVKSCSFNTKSLLKNGVTIRFYHNHLYTSRRKILHHENELQSEVEKRRCVLWDDEIGETGGWTSEHATTLITEQDSTLCEFHTFGIFAILAESVEPLIKPKSRTWLTILPKVGFLASSLLLGLLIIIIVRKKFLWNMFHLVRLNTLISLLLIILFAFLSEIEAVRDDIHYNAGIGTCLVYFCCSLTTFLLMESIMYVAGITDGVIGGYSSSYMLFGWSIPMFPIGVTWYFYGVEIGTDPLCFMGWNNYTKYPFFIHIYTMLGISILLSPIILCNNSSPETHKDSMIDDLRSMSTGLVAMTYFVSLIWAFAYLTILRHPREEIKDFYPIFWVFTSLLGVLAFPFLGLSSNQINDVLLGDLYSSRLLKFKRMTAKEMESKNKKTNPKRRKRRLEIRKSRKVEGKSEDESHNLNLTPSIQNENILPSGKEPSKVEEEKGNSRKGPPIPKVNSIRKKMVFSSESEDSMSIDDNYLDSSDLSSSSDVEMNYNNNNTYLESSDSN